MTQLGLWMTGEDQITELSAPSYTGRTVDICIWRLTLRFIIGPKSPNGGTCIPKMTQKLADRRVQSAENRRSQSGLYCLDTTHFAIVDFRQLSIPPIGQLLSHFGYNSKISLGFFCSEAVEIRKIRLKGISDRDMMFAKDLGTI